MVAAATSRALIELRFAAIPDVFVAIFVTFVAIFVTFVAMFVAFVVTSVSEPTVPRVVLMPAMAVAFVAIAVV